MGTTTSAAVLLAAMCLNPVKDVVLDRVDLVEVNHFYDEQGQLVFDQIIFYDWCPVQCRFNVRDWRLLKCKAQVPHRQWGKGDFVAIWHDGGTLRKVRADAIRESWTQYDPELVERDFLPKDRRRELGKFLIRSTSD